MYKTAIFCNNEANVDRVFGQGRLDRIKEISVLYPVIITERNLWEHLPKLGEIDAVFSTWGMPLFSERELDAMPDLKCVFYAAGSVKNFARPLIERGIQVINAASANGIFVAEYAVSQILLANKGYFCNVRVGGGSNARPDYASVPAPGNFDTEVGVLGAGKVGRRVLQMLGSHNLHIMVYDPYLSAVEAKDFGAEKASLQDIFSRCMTVSNHVPDIPVTRGMIEAKLLSALPQGGTFINTGRGATVVEADLIGVLAKRPDLTALLDVTDPEPLEENSPLCRMPNVYLTGHIAGALGNEVVAMADECIDKFIRFSEGKPLSHTITLAQLDIMA